MDKCPHENNGYLDARLSQVKKKKRKERKEIGKIQPKYSHCYKNSKERYFQGATKSHHTIPSIITIYPNTTIYAT
jgi:hypothetical protein